jgi:hypothetical protein
MASFHLELTDHRGSQFHGPFAGVTVIGANPELCQLTLPGNLSLESRHAELRPTEISYQLILSPCSSMCRVYLWRQGRPWLLAQPSVIQHGERFSLLTPDGPTFRVLAMAQAEAPDPNAPRTLPKLGGGTTKAVLGCLGLMFSLGLMVAIAQWSFGPDTTRSTTWWSRDKAQAKKQPQKEQFEQIMERKFVRNNKGNPSREMDRWTTISGTNNYRSARIHSFEQLRMIKEKYGIKIVLNLAMDAMSPQKDPARGCGGLRRPCEPIWAKELGLIYHKVYLGSKPPKDEDWERILGYLKAGDTLVHCTHGVDRTGAVVGKWQHVVDPTLTRDELMDYTTSFGGQWKLSGDPNRHLRAWMLADASD